MDDDDIDREWSKEMWRHQKAALKEKAVFQVGVILVVICFLIVVFCK